MKLCTHCGRKNPDDAGFCYKCGNPLGAVAIMPASKSFWSKSFWSKLPSWAWIIIGLAAIALTLGIIVGGFVAMVTLEGIASMLFLIAGILVFRVFSGTRPSNVPVIRAIFIGFFALMGATVDQPGNYVYNKPVEWCYCEDGASLNRTTDVSHPLPGRTDMTQDFTCWKNGQPVLSINALAVMGIRFIEYVLLSYLLMGLRWLFWKTRS